MLDAFEWITQSQSMSATPVLMHVEPECGVLWVGPGAAVTLAITSRSVAARHRPSGRPDTSQLEPAIGEVENAIEQAGPDHAGRTGLAATALLVLRVAGHEAGVWRTPGRGTAARCDADRLPCRSAPVLNARHRAL